MREDAGELGGTEPGQQGHGHRAGLVDALVRHEPLERLVVADEQPAPSPGVESVLHEFPGEPVGTTVPFVEGDLGAVGQIPPGHRRRELQGQLGQQLRLEQCHGTGDRGGISRGRRLRGSRRGSVPASS